MILVCCIEDNFGMAFNRRRVSRDSALCADLAATAGTSPIYLDSRSEALFDGLGANIVSCPDFAEKAGSGEYCFLEFAAPAVYEGRAEKIILSRWNRRYPSDLKFDIALDSWQLESTVDFPGSSHETVTKEVYIRD